MSNNDIRVRTLPLHPAPMLGHHDPEEYERRMREHERRALWLQLVTQGLATSEAAVKRADEVLAAYDARFGKPAA